MYQVWSVVADEQPTTNKWNILGANDAGFYDGTGFAAGALGADNSSLATGMVRQVVSVGYSASATGTTLLPYDDTIPQSAEGTEFMSLSITPKSATNILVIDVTLFGSVSATGTITTALFQDSTADALAMGLHYETVATATHTVNFSHKMVAGTTSATTFKVRAGSESAGTFTFNGAGGTRRFGATTKSSIVITEYKA